MHNRLITALTLILLLASSAVFAQQSDDPLQKALDKCARQHAAIHDMTVNQEITIPSPEGNILANQTSYEMGDKSRMEMTMQPPPGADTTGMSMGLGKVTTVSDGKTTWLLSPMMGKQQVTEKNDPSSANCWGLKFEKAKVTGSEAVNGKDCWIVESGKQDSIADRYWLEKKTLTVLKGESKDLEGHVLHWALSDFRPILGSYDYPYKMDVFNGDSVVASMTVQNITVNTGLADTLFDPDRLQENKSDMQEMLRRLMEQQGQDSMPSDSADSTGSKK